MTAIVRCLALAAVATATLPSCANAPASSGTDALIANLDLRSFPNSTGPRREPGKATFADYGFTQVEKTAQGVVLTRGDDEWFMRFEILADGPERADICFHDNAGRGPGGTHGGSYRATAALRVPKSPAGRWSATRVVEGFAHCRNDPEPD